MNRSTSVNQFHFIVILMLGLCCLPEKIFSQTSASEMWFIRKRNVTGNLSFVSNYLFRGESLSDNKPAVQGGIDFEHTLGTFMGIWASSGSKKVPLEVDLYAGCGYNFSKNLGIEAKFLGYFYPHVEGDNTLEGSLTTYIYWLGVRYNYDFILQQSYFEFGIRYEFNSRIWGKIRAGDLIPDEAKGQRPGSEPKPDDKSQVWDFEVKGGYSFTKLVEVFAVYVDQQVVGNSVAIGLIVNFTIHE